MQQINEGRLKFFFPDNTVASKYDDWSFYRNQFNRSFGGTKAIDIVHVDAGQTWLIEIKDYRRHRRTKAIDIGDEISLKVRDTLAGLTAAQCNANNPNEKAVARKAIRKNRIRIILHLEQPRKHSKLFPKAIDPSKLELKLKQRLKSVDAHPLVVDTDTLANRPEINWNVKGI